jgi:hypothetical protein
MRTISKPYSSFQKNIIVFALSFVISHTTLSQPLLSGLGLEIGGGYNQLFSQSSIPIPITNDTKFDRIQFALTPEVRLKYNFQIIENVNCIPFVGYNRFGGKSEDSHPGPNGSDYAQSDIWVDALEIGLFTTYALSDFSFGIGYKANRNFKVMGWYTFPNAPTWNIDFTPSFPTFSHDVGFRVSYRLSNYNIAAESWFGVTDLGGTGYLVQTDIRQNHFRILVGYTL